MTANLRMKFFIAAITWGVTGLLVLEFFAFFGAPLLPGMASPLALALQNARGGPQADASVTRAAEAVQIPDSSAVVRIRSVNVNAPIIFPSSADRVSLEDALTKGVVHYPMSAYPNESSGNVFLFGHSTSRPVVKNPAYTVFTKLNQIRPGEDIEIYYKDRVYAYKTKTIRVLKPWEAEVYLETSERMLTLSTCWPIGDPNNRFIVEAEFVRSYPRRSIASAADASA